MDSGTVRPRRSLRVVAGFVGLIFGLAGCGSSQTTKADWTQLHLAVNPPSQSYVAMAADPVTHRLVLLTGRQAPDTVSMWAWTGAAWVQLHPSNLPPVESKIEDPATYEPISVDPVTNRLVTFSFSQSLAWTWTGTDWVQLHSITNPPSNCATQSLEGLMAPDPQSKRLILWCPGINPETWTWTGSTWVQLSPTASPTTADTAAMAVDPVKNRIILFKGRQGSGPKSSDMALQDQTWTWENGTWVQLSPAASPSPQASWSPLLAVDPGTHQLLLKTTAPDTNQVWHWTGVTWQMLTTNTTATEGSANVMATDPVSHRILLFSDGQGGGEFQGFTNLHDTWVFP